MSRELNKIFDVKSRQARRDILDKFDLSKEDKNKVLNKIDSGGGSDSGSGSGSSVPQYYKFDKDAAMASNLDLFRICHYIVGACALIRNEWYDTIEIQTSGRWIYALWDSGGNFGRGDVLNYLVGLCFIPCKMTSESHELKQYNTLEEFSAEHGVENTSFLIPISEEEFYSSEFFYPQS